MLGRRELLYGLAPVAQAPATVYHNGTVVTMDAADSVREAVAVRGGRILAVGAAAEVTRQAGPGAHLVDLRGKTLLPGFYAAHDHFPASGLTALYEVDLNSPPMGRIERIEDIVAALRTRSAKTPPGEWVVGRGYDDTLVREKRHPTRADLDRASAAHPICIVHVSGHLSVANSRALAIAGVTRDTPQPAGGVIRKDPATGEPDGVFEEVQIVRNKIPPYDSGQRLQAIRRADAEYLAKGVTTTVITGAPMERVRDLSEAFARGWLRLRAHVMLPGGTTASLAEARRAGVAGRIRVVGIKLFQDGSLQGYTGYLSAPYYKQPEGKSDYRGYPARKREELVALVDRHHRAGFQIAIHANGDAAIDDVLFAYREALRSTPRKDARHRIEHCQTPREDQLDAMRELGISPSFFAAHVYYWGDRHRDIFLGGARAVRISPLASVARRGLRFTLHNDTPVTPVDPLLSVWVAVNRVTRGGRQLGPEQRISAIAALRAVTSGAAWQNHDEHDRGSIEPGKTADFVLLEENPLTADPMRIKNIAVLETIVGGETVYRRG